MSEHTDITKEAIKDWRTRRGYSVAHAARKIEVEPSTWLRWEKGQTTPSEEYQVRLQRLFELGDIWTHVSEETTKALRMMAFSIPLIDFAIEGLPSVFAEGPKRENESLEYARTWYLNEFVNRKPRKLTGDEKDIFRQTGFFALYAGYGVAMVKYSTDMAKIRKYGRAVDWIFMDLTGLQHHIRNDLWFEAFDANFAAGYALGVGEILDRLGQETHGFQPMPHSLDGERAVLGCLLMDPSVRSDLMATLAEDDFFVEAHQRVFEAIKGLSLRNETVNLASVCAEMKRRGTLESAGGPGRVKELGKSVTGYREVMDWARVVKEHSARRQVIGTAKTIISECYGDAGPSDSSLAQLRKKAEELKSAGSGVLRTGPEPEES